jgi:hypothetical protein
MDEITALPIEQLMRRLQQNDLSRSRFMAILAGLGASATGVRTLMAAQCSAATLPARRRPGHHKAEHQHMKLHQAHVQRQACSHAPGAGCFQ